MKEFIEFTTVFFIAAILAMLMCFNFSTQPTVKQEITTGAVRG